MKEETRQNFEMAHYHNRYRSNQGISGQDLIGCMADIIRQHAYTLSVSKCESFDGKDDLALIVDAFVAYKQGSLMLSSREEQDIPLAGLFSLVARRLKQELY